MIQGALVLVDMHSEVPVQFWNIVVKDDVLEQKSKEDRNEQRKRAPEGQKRKEFTEEEQIHNLMTVIKAIFCLNVIDEAYYNGINPYNRLVSIHRKGQDLIFGIFIGMFHLHAKCFEDTVPTP